MTIILVTGVTGQQGGATVNALLNSNTTDLTIRGLTRNPSSSAAKELASRGVEIVRGDFSDESSVLAALQDVTVAYLVTDFSGPKKTEGEVEQGTTFVDCAERAKIKHIVFSSVAGADTAREVPHFHSKYVVEEYIKSHDMTYTFLRPTNFMENTPPPGVGRFFFFGVMKAIFGEDKIYHIAAEDIGKVAAAAMLTPEKYRNRIVNLVGEIANADEIKASFDRAEGHVCWRAWVPRWLIMKVMPNEFFQMFTWLSKTYANNEMPGTVEELKSLISDVVDLETWAKKGKSRREVDTVRKEA